MRPADVLRGLNAIRRTLKRYLEARAVAVLSEAAEQAEASYKRYEEQRRRGCGWVTWGYCIPPESPLVFEPRTVRGFRLQVDLFCRVMWSSPDEPPCQQSLAIRVWSLDRHVIYRSDLDSKEILDRVVPLGRRVMLRYHFDLADALQPGPRCHVQAGGNPRPEEFCWLHEGISIPRLPYPPIDLVLACELVVANFLGYEFPTVLDDPEWKTAVSKSQQDLLRRYYEQCLKVLEEGQSSLLRYLWGAERE